MQNHKHIMQCIIHNFHLVQVFVSICRLIDKTSVCQFSLNMSTWIILKFICKKISKNNEDTPWHSQKHYFVLRILNS